MKILHLPSTFLPYYVGGKEIFVKLLVHGLQQYAVETAVAFHQTTKKEPIGSYFYEDIPIWVLPPIPIHQFRRSYFTSLYDELPGFAELLDTYQPDIVHLHDQGYGSSLSHLRELKRRGIQTVLTYHSPGQSCAQRSLLYGGKTPCDGFISERKCSRCRALNAGAHPVIAQAAARLPALPFDMEKDDTIHRFLGLKKTTQLFKDAFDEFYSTIDCVQVHAQWVKEMLLRNGVSPEKIVHIPQMGLPTMPISLQPDKTQKYPASGTLKLVFVGRCADVKGVHLLIEAVKKLPAHIPVKVSFFGPSWDDSEYGQQLLTQMEGDKRFNSPRLIPNHQVPEIIAQHDVCVVPSLWPETGPFSVLDAWAAGVPVLGANLAGIAERVQEGVNGWLFKWGNSNDLAKKIEWLATDPTALNIVLPEQENEKNIELFYRMYTRLYNSNVTLSKDVKYEIL